MQLRCDRCIRVLIQHYLARIRGFHERAWHDGLKWSRFSFWFDRDRDRQFSCSIAVFELVSGLYTLLAFDWAGRFVRIEWSKYCEGIDRSRKLTGRFECSKDQCLKELFELTEGVRTASMWVSISLIWFLCCYVCRLAARFESVYSPFWFASWLQDLSDYCSHYSE